MGSRRRVEMGIKRTFTEYKESLLGELYEEWKSLDEDTQFNFFDGRFIRVGSSNLHGITYHFLEQELFVDFNNGRTYKYYGVPQDEFMGLLEADSKGRYFHNNIRFSYEYQEV